MNWPPIFWSAKGSMSENACNSHGWFDLAGCVRREIRRRDLRALLVRPRIISPLKALRIVVLLSLIIAISKASLVEAFFVPSASMTPTLRVSDYILVPKFLYGLHIPLVNDVVVKWAKPERGDVIVFKRNAASDALEGDEALVKRVIAVEGDIVEIVGNKVLINREPLEEPYVQSSHAQHGAGYHFGPRRVPSGKVFVLGDNRDESEDSRFWSDPFVSLSQVVGKAVMVYWSGSQDSPVGRVL